MVRKLVWRKYPDTMYGSYDLVDNNTVFRGGSALLCVAFLQEQNNKYYAHFWHGDEHDGDFIEMKRSWADVEVAKQELLEALK